MWLLRFHLIATRDYNKIDRIIERTEFFSRKFSNMLLVKGMLLHVLQGKSWRQAATELHMASHIPLYQFYEYIRYTPEGDEIIEYMIHRRIALHLRDMRHITPEMLDSDDIVEESLDAWRERV